MSARTKLPNDQGDKPRLLGTCPVLTQLTAPVSDDRLDDFIQYSCRRFPEVIGIHNEISRPVNFRSELWGVMNKSLQCQRYLRTGALTDVDIQRQIKSPRSAERLNYQPNLRIPTSHDKKKTMVMMHTSRFEFLTSPSTV